MPSFALKVLMLLAIVFVAYADVLLDSNKGLNHLSNNDGDSTEQLDRRTFTRPTNSPPIYKPTPPIASLPVETTTSSLIVVQPPVRPPRPLIPDVVPGPVKPSLPIVLQTPGPVESVTLLPTPPICGKKRNCYQWFDNEWDLVLDGYTRCDATDIRRARRYCCTA